MIDEKGMELVFPLWFSSVYYLTLGESDEDED